MLLYWAARLGNISDSKSKNGSELIVMKLAIMLPDMDLLVRYLIKILSWVAIKINKLSITGWGISLKCS